jgi:GTP-binding protein
VERTRVLLHLLDANPLEGDPVEAYRTVRREIEAYGHGLAERPEVLALTKVDTLPAGPEREAVLRRVAREVDRAVHPVSAVAGLGLEALVGAVVAALDAADPPPGPPPRAPSSPDAPPDGGTEGPECSTTSSSTSR